MQDHRKNFNKMVQSRIETLTTTEGKVYLSADDLFSVLKQMSEAAGRMAKTAPHPVLTLQAETVRRNLETVSEAIQSAANCEKSRQPSRN